MTAVFKRRLEALEACAARVEIVPPLFIIRIVSPGHLDDEPTCARIGDEVLMRSPDEAVDDFEGRAKAVALRQQSVSGGLALVRLDTFEPAVESMA